MPTDHNIRQLVINKMTDAQYEQAVKNADELYLTPYSGEGGGTDLPDQTGQSGKFLTTNGSTLSWANVPAGTVTSVRVQATSPIQSSTSTAQSSTLNTTISLANGYGDTKNPYGTKNVNYVLAGPSSGSAAEPTFRALTKADIPLASEIATSGGTTTSLVTTGEKYIWDNKQDALTTQTAYTSKGTATKVPQITTNNLGQVTGITEVNITQPTVNNSTILLTQGGVNKGSFTLNQATDSIIDFDKSGAELNIVDNSGSTLPTPQTIGETFLNTTDKKIYTAEAGEYVLGDGIVNTGNLDISTGEISGFTTTKYLNGSARLGTIPINVDIHFKTGLDVTTKQGIMDSYAFNSSTHQTTGRGNITIEEGILKIQGTQVCSVQTITDYHIIGTISSVSSSTRLTVSVKENNIEIVSSTAYSFNYSTTSSNNYLIFGVFRGSQSIYSDPFLGILYGNTVWKDTILVSEGEAGWNDGTALTNDAICQDETNKITYLYQNNKLININELPIQTGQSGKFLTTNGNTVSWANVDTLPSQSGQSGKFLTTNGTTMSWATVSSGGKFLTFTNIFVDASEWVSDQTYADYPYAATITCQGVTSSDFAYVVFAPGDFDSGLYANVCLTGTDTVTIYAKEEIFGTGVEVLDPSITIPTIVVMGA